MRNWIALLAAILATQAWADSTDRATERVETKAGFGSHGGDAIVTFQTKADRNRVLQVILDNKKNGTNNDPLEGIDLNTLEVELLDLWFARTRGLNGKGDGLIDAKGTMEEIVQERLLQFKDKTTFYNTLKSYLEGEMSSQKWTPSKNGVIEVDDSGLSVYSGPFELPLQIAVQNQFRVFYDERLFKRMNPLNQAGLVYHEMIYRHAIRIGHQDSTATQPVVGEIFSKSFERMTGIQINQLLEDHKMIGPGSAVSAPEPIELGGNVIEFVQTKRYIEASKTVVTERFPNWAGEDPKGDLWKDSLIDGIWIKSGAHRHYDVEFYGSGRLKTGTVAKDGFYGDLPVQAGMIVELSKNGKIEKMWANPREMSVRGHTIPEGSRVSFDQSGALLSILTRTPTRFNGIDCGNGEAGFHRSGILSNCNLNKDQAINGIPVKGSPYRVFLHENGKVASGYLAKETELKKRKGWIKTVKCGKEVEFSLDSEGFVTQCGTERY